MKNRGKRALVKANGESRCRELELIHMVHAIQESTGTSGHAHDEHDDEPAGGSK